MFHKKSAGVAYVLWFFLGMGAQRFRSDRVGTGIAVLALAIIGLASLSPNGSGGGFVVIAATWVLIDLFLISGWIRKYNMDLVTKLAGATPNLAR